MRAVEEERDRGGRFAGIDDGRADLVAWEAEQPDNAYAADRHFREVLALHAGDALATLEADLLPFGAAVAGELDALVRENNLHVNLPRLERHDGVGVAREQVIHHPAYHLAGEGIYGAGLIAALAEEPVWLGALARFYVSSTLGEAGHNCPVACTAGLVRVLQQLAPEPLQQRYLPGLLDRDYDRHLEGAQFLTEVQGGSDVGANACIAEPAGDARYRLSGEKWFCSNIDADLFLMTARRDAADSGTRGLGLFLVPRHLDDGRPNGFAVRRLKDKLGTRSMASGEVDFDGALGWHMGPLDAGFKNMMRLVIHTSRLYNAVGCCGLARRAYVTARGYARRRRAFGHTIADYPLVQETLAGIKAECDAMVSASFHIAALQDRLEAGRASEQEQDFLRLAVNLNKVRSAKSARWAVVEGIEVLGGNGAIETFSVLPRLLRDAIVYENWEGTHNTLLMQMWRDMHKARLQQGFGEHLAGLLAGSGGQRAERLGGWLAAARADLDRVLQLDQRAGPVALRPLLDRLSYLMYAIVRQHELDRLAEPDPASAASLDLLLAERLAAAPERDPAHLDRIQQIAESL